MVGGRDFQRSEFNRATQSRRQPGSAFKPLIYTAAFDKGMTPATVIVDEPIFYPDPQQPDGIWKPKNFDEKFWGPTTLHNALIHSRNIITIKVLQEIGIDYAMAYAQNMGIGSPLGRNLSLALGTSGVTLQELQSASGFCAQNQRRLHFGLGAATAVKRAVIPWPGGREQVLERPAINQLHRLKDAGALGRLP